MNFLRTLRTNWRDFVAALVVSIAFSYFADIVTSWSAVEGSLKGLSDFANILRIGALLISVNAFVFLLVLPITWPTLNTYGNELKPEAYEHAPEIRESFRSGFKSLSEKERFFVYLGIASVELIAGALLK